MISDGFGLCLVVFSPLACQWHVLCLCVRFGSIDVRGACGNVFWRWSLKGVDVVSYKNAHMS